MALQIEDGRGTGQKVAVSPTGNRLDVSARSNPRIYYVSRDDSNAYSAYSEDASAAAGDFILYLKNTSTSLNLYIDDIIFDAANDSKFKLHKVTGTASGTDIVPTNLNFRSGNTATAEVKGSGAVTGLTSSSTLLSERILGNTSSEFKTSDTIRLGLNDAIAIEYDTGTTGAADASVIFYFDAE